MRVSIPGVRAPAGELVVHFEGRAVPARPGDTVAAALMDAGEDAGVFCGMGVCQQCLVKVDGVAGRRACMTAAVNGMRIERQPDRPSVEEAPEQPTLDNRELSPDLLVIGGGPAGMTAAVTAAEAGIDVVLVDEREKLGGQYYKQPTSTVDESKLDRQFVAGRRLAKRVRTAGVTVLGGTQVWGAFGPHEIHASSDTTRYTLRPERLVLAAGAYERGVPLPGWTLPGVITTGAAQTLLRAHQVAPGKRVLISGNGPLNMQVAAELVRAGVTVVALAELAPITRRAAATARMMAAAPDLARDGLGYLATLRKARVPLMTGSAVVRCEGSGRVERATVAKLDDPHTATTFDVDAVCLGFGFLPSNELSRALGCRHDVERNQLVVRRDHRGRTTVDGVWVAGDAGGIGGARLAQATGAIAGADVARSLGATPPDTSSAARERRKSARFQEALWRVYEAPHLVDALADDDTEICRCEHVRKAAIDAALAEDIAHIGALKRLTRAGMGGCQGRYCGTLLAEMAARRSDATLDEYALFAPSAPLKPTPIAAIAECDSP
ncbi:MAG TPA: FAD-dependent oxidoreductase [Solirubrobacter sp.]|nr:FAD-dependent oxidoreductase [Solirubrobacter sp.]